MTRDPKQDLPFPTPIIAYISKGLEIADIEPDRPWLSRRRQEPVTDWEMGVLLARSGVYSRLPFARRAIPQAGSFWEMAPFFEAAIAPAAFDLTQGIITSYPPFRFLYARLLGVAAMDWLPSLYLAAAAVPTIETIHRVKLIDNFVPDFLDQDF